MKKYLFILALAGSFLFTSCESFLDEPLKGEHSSDNIFNTPAEADLVLTGVYNNLSFTTSSNMIWVFGDIASDDAVKGGNPGDQADMTSIDNFEVKSSNGVLYTYWKFTYEGISRANNVITGVYNSGIDDATKQQMIAEAKFIRAYHYFNLVNIWGKVPLRLVPSSPSNVNLGLSEVADVYAQIEKDLKEAAAVLPASYDAANAGRVTKGAAFGLLAKAQLYQQKWDESISTIVNNIEPLGYDLEPNYATLFKLGAENSKEVVFAVRHMSNKNPGVGNSLNQWFAPLIENGYYTNAPTASYVASFDETTIDGKTDPRLDISIGRDGHNWVNGEPFDPTWSTTGYLIRKHNQPASEVAWGTKGDGGLPYIYMRYADILLMKAEAYTEKGNLSEGVAALDKVRARAGLDKVKAVSQSQMRSAIYTERRRELGFEFHRFFDLMRWGQEVASAALGPNFKWESPRYYFPLPQAEVDSNHGIK